MKILHQKSSQPHQNPITNPSQPHQQPITRFHGWTQHHHYPIRPMLRCHPPTPSNPSPPASLLGRNPAQVPGFWNQPNPGSRLLGGTRPRFQAPGGYPIQDPGSWEEPSPGSRPLEPGSRVGPFQRSGAWTGFLPGAWNLGWVLPRRLDPGRGSLYPTTPIPVVKRVQTFFKQHSASFNQKYKFSCKSWI